MRGADHALPDPAASPAAEHWSAQVAAWPGAGAAVLPLADIGASRATAWAREVLPPSEGAVLDIGCGAGAAALALVPPAAEVIGVDPTGALLDEFIVAADALGVARRTVHGPWPDVVATTPVADVAICHHLLPSIGDIVPFLYTLTDRARLAVVVELPLEHPSPPLRATAAALGFEGKSDPIRGADLVSVLAELGLDPESATDERRVAGGGELADLAPVIRRWLGLDADRDGEIAEAVARHAEDRTVETVTIRWPGAAEVPRTSHDGA